MPKNNYAKKSKFQLRKFQTLLIFTLLTTLVWSSDVSLIDSITLPRTMLFALLALIIMSLNFSLVWDSLSRHPLFMLTIFLFSIPVCFGIPYVDKFYGESQRINGTFQIVLSSTSLAIGFIYGQYNFLPMFKRLFILNGLAVSTLIVISQYVAFESSLLTPWTRGNIQGGINENFKSLFISLSLLLHLKTFKLGRREKNRQFLFIASILIHFIALVLIGSFQGFLLILLASVFFVCVSQNKLRFGILLISLIYFIVYCAFLFESKLESFLDSSSLERIYLARRAIEILEYAPIIVPNPIRISENNFTDVMLSSSTTTDLWVDDVHNVYLNAGNTFGIFFLGIILIVFILFVFDFTKNAPTQSHEIRMLGAIGLATLHILVITIINPIYFLPLCILIGGYFASLDKKGNRSKIFSDLDVFGSKTFFDVSRRRVGLMISIILVSQLFFGATLIVREYSTQKEAKRVFFSKTSTEKTSRFEDFEQLETLLDSSRDLRFVYEYGRYNAIQGNCQNTLRVLSILQKRSQDHYFTKKLKSLHEECLSR